MTNLSFLDKLLATHPEMELWFDSPPVRYEKWITLLLNNPASGLSETAPAFKVKYLDTKNPEAGQCQNFTTNPRLVYETLTENPALFSHLIAEIQDFPVYAPDTDSLYLLLYKQFMKLNADIYREVWEQSNGTNGWVCAQLPPKLSFDTERMIAVATELHAIAPNIMIKVVGSEQGYQVIEALTAKGIATNNTLSFTFPQCRSCAEAILRGRRIAARNGVDLSRWRAVITYMMGRFGAQDNFIWQASERGIQLSPEDIRWAETVLFKKQYEYLIQNAVPAKIVLCSLRIDHWYNQPAAWHFTKTAGTNIIYTLPPALISQLLQLPENAMDLQSDGWKMPIPEDVFAKLMAIPYFSEAYNNYGIEPEDFAFHPAFLQGLGEVNQAYYRTIDLITNHHKSLHNGTTEIAYAGRGW